MQLVPESYEHIHNTVFGLVSALSIIVIIKSYTILSSGSIVDMINPAN